MDERRRLNYGDRKVIEEGLDSGWKLADIADELECDPYASWQKPHIENAHTLLRRVLPKGSSFDGLTQDNVNLVCSHINSYPREELGWADDRPTEQAEYDRRLSGLGALIARACREELWRDCVELAGRLA